MTVIGSAISWTDSTWNLWVGCRQVSAGCDNCYAKQLVDVVRPHVFQRIPFDRFNDKMAARLPDVSKFRPRPRDGGGVRPHLVFVNSLSDFFFEDVPDGHIHAVLDVMEQRQDIAFQVLSKRPIRARKILVDRYGGRGIPEHIWIGFTVEDNRVAARLRMLRTIQDRTGGGTYFASVEPIVGPTNELDFAGLDWIITGGESGPGARIMQREWLMAPIRAALRGGIAIWHKQSGTAASHPNLSLAPASYRRPIDRYRWLVTNGHEKMPEEKGGATVDGATYRQLPAAYSRQSDRLNQSPPAGLL